MWKKVKAVESQSNEHKRVEDASDDIMAVAEGEQENEEVAPGVSVIRSNTPRPLTLHSELALHDLSQLEEPEASEEEIQPSFPAKAPSAPPLPEEIDEEEESVEEGSTVTTAPVETVPQFTWLFEYGLEMDPTVLNSVERMDGQALLYGPAVLKGYSILLGTLPNEQKTLATIEPGPEAKAEVWGVLYRVPQRLTKPVDDEASLLDRVHAAAPPRPLFRPVQAVVREAYRSRDISCITYIATEAVRQQLQPLSLLSESGGTAFVQQLAAAARKQKLPMKYLGRYMMQEEDAATTEEKSRLDTALIEYAPQDTEPLPAFQELQEKEASKEPLLPRATTRRRSSLLTLFATYLVFTLLLTLTFAVLHGIGFARAILNEEFTLLGVPWLVLMYGLLGGCISCLLTLSQYRSAPPPLFIVITWFTRPFVGAVLALFTYLLLSSGLFVFQGGIMTHRGIFLLAGALAGICEGWLFVQKR